MTKPQFPFFTDPVTAPQLNDHFGSTQFYLAKTLAIDIQYPTSPGTADVPFLVLHNLGEVPRSFSAVMEAAGSVYAAPEDKRQWSEKGIVVRCSVAKCAMILEIKA